MQGRLIGRNRALRGVAIMAGVGLVALLTACEPPNTVPTAVGDGPYTVAEDAVLSVPAPGVLANDSDPDGSAVTVALPVASPPAHGTVVAAANGSFTYTPAANFSGADSFTYKASDGTGQSSAATVTITVTPQPDAPTGVALTPATVAENRPAGTIVGTLSSTDPDPSDPHIYALVAGTGDSDNASFQVDGDQLKTTTSFDFEARSADAIRVRTTDGDGLSFEQALQVTVTDANDAPTDVTLTPSTVVEGQPSGTTVGTLAAVDPDSAGAPTFALVAGSGATNNSSFSISGALLRTTAPLALGSYAIRVKATDAGGLSVEKALLVVATAAPHPPTDLSLSASTVAEDQPSGTTVGGLSSTDPDVGATFTYSLVPGTGSTNNAQFKISGSQLQTNASLDFEAGATRSVRIRTTDDTGASFEKAFTITVTNVNEAPTALSLSPSSVLEDQPGGTAIGTLSGVDPDAGSALTYSLVAGTGSTNNAAVQISGTQLRTAIPLDHETSPTLAIRVKATDAGGLSFEQALTVTVTDVNEAPTDLTLSPSSLDEGKPSGTTVGTLAAVDPDAGSTATFSLVSGTGSTSNASFTISGAQVKTAAVLPAGSYSIRVKATDAGGLSFEKALTVTVADLPNPPTNITLSASTVAENQPTGTLVGNLSTTDPDVGDTFTYALVPGTGSSDNARFQISGAQLQTAAGLDFEAGASRSVRIRTTDSTGASFEKAFAVTVTNVNEAPTDLTLSPATVLENKPAGTAIGTLAGVDPDAGSTLTFALVGGTGSTDNAAVQISGTQLSTAIPLDRETSPTLSIRVQVADAGGLTFQKVLTITVGDVNDAPFATADSYAVNGTLTVAAPGVLTNDTDPEGGALTAFLVTGPAHAGSFGLNADGSFTYTVQSGVSASTDTFTYQAVDPGGLHSTTVTVTLSFGNPPVVTLDGGALAYTENGPAIAISPNLTVIDADSANLASAQVDLSAGGWVNGQDRLVIGGALPPGVTSSGVSATGVLQLTGSATVAQYQAVLRSVTYQNLADAFTSTTRTVAFRVSDGTTTSVDVTRGITITPVNDAPALADAAAATTYAEQSATAAVVSPTATITDPDDADLESATLTISSPVTGDQLTFTNQSGIGGTFAGATLTLTGSATKASYQTALRSVGFKNATSDNPGSSRTVTVKVNDGSVDSNTLSRTITVTAVNDPPANAVPATQTGTEDVAKVFSTANGNAITVADPDAATLQVKLTATNGTVALAGTAGLTINAGANGSGTVTFTGTPAAINAALDGLSFLGSSNYNVAWAGDSSLTVLTSDLGSSGTGGTLTDSDVVIVNLAAANDAPVAPAQSFSAQANMGLDDHAISLTGITDPDSADPGYTASFTLNSVTPGADCTGCTVTDVKGTGSFDFEPGPGLTGAHTLQYMVKDGGSPAPGVVSAPATLTVNISGPVIWFVDDSAAAGGNGTMAKPFQTLTQADAVDAASSGIFLYSGTYANGITLNASEKLIGQGVTQGSCTSSACFDNAFAISPPAGTNARPSVNGTRPIISNLVTFGGNGGVLRGVDLTPASGTQGVAASGRTALTVSEVSVTAVNAPAVNLVNSDGTFSFTKVNANGGPDGIVWTNTSPATGSFTITGGTGTTADGSGGQILNMTGADGSTNGIGIYLKDARAVNLDQVALASHQGWAIRGDTVGTSFTLTRALINGTNGTNDAFDEGSVLLTEATGTVTVDGSTIAGGWENSFTVQNTSGSVDFVGSNSTWRTSDSAVSADALLLNGSVAATINASITNNQFTGAGDNPFDYVLNNSGQGNVTFTGNAVSNDNTHIAGGGGGVSIGLGGGQGSFGPMTYDISGNTFRDAKGSALAVFVDPTTGTATGTISGNTIGVANVALSGSSQAGGIRVETLYRRNNTVSITGNVVHQTNEEGIKLHMGETPPGGTGTTMRATVKGNTVDTPGSFAFAGIYVNAGTFDDDFGSMCLDLGGATAADKNKVSTGDPANAGDVYVQLGAGAMTINLPGYGGGFRSTGDVATFLAPRNDGDGTPAVTAVIAPSNTTGGFTGTGTSCS